MLVDFLFVFSLTLILIFLFSEPISGHTGSPEKKRRKDFCIVLLIVKWVRKNKDEYEQGYN